MSSRAKQKGVGWSNECHHINVITCRVMSFVNINAVDWAYIYIWACYSRILGKTRRIRADFILMKTRPQIPLTVCNLRRVYMLTLLFAVTQACFSMAGVLRTHRGGYCECTCCGLQTSAHWMLDLFLY